MNETQVLESHADYIIEQYLHGQSTIAIAKEFGCSGTLVGNILKSRNISLRYVPKFEDYKDKILELYKSGITTSYRIARELDLSDVTTQRYMAKLGIDISCNSKNRDDPVKNHTDEIIKLYNSGIGCYKLSHMFKCSESSILKLLKKNNIEIRDLRQYQLDEGYFEKISTWDRAYLYGVICADASIDNIRHSLRLGMTDIEPVEFLRICTKTESAIKLIQPRGKSKKLQYLLRLCSRRMCDDLRRHNCGGNKTFTLKWPTDDIVPLHLKPAFLLGFHDGDASASLTRNRHPIIQCIGCRTMILPMANFLSETLGINVCVIERPYKNSPPEIIKLSIGSVSGVLKYIDYIYQDYQCCIPRKRATCVKIKEICKDYKY